MTSRILATLAAACFVAAFALAALLPPDLDLTELLAMLDHRWPGAAQDFMRAHVSGWLWDNLLRPLCERPAWLMPASLGLILAGAAATAASRPGAARSRRRRS